MTKQYKAEPHHLLPIGKKSGCAYSYCVHCGFINMKNELSQWVMKQGCNHKEHPSWKNKLGLTNPFTKVN